MIPQSGGKRAVGGIASLNRPESEFPLFQLRFPVVGGSGN
jgi:hypothetical protein